MGILFLSSLYPSPSRYTSGCCFRLRLACTTARDSRCMLLNNHPNKQHTFRRIYQNDEFNTLLASLKKTLYIQSHIKFSLLAFLPILAPNASTTLPSDCRAQIPGSTNHARTIYHLSLLQAEPRVSHTETSKSSLLFNHCFFCTIAPITAVTFEGIVLP